MDQHTLLPAAALESRYFCKKYSQFQVSNKDRFFYDPWAGYLRSGQALTDLLQLAHEAGIVVRENTVVRGVEDTPNGVNVLCTSNLMNAVGLALGEATVLA